MIIAFHILRLNWYRPFAPLIDEALRRGHQVECWHNAGNKNLGANTITADCMPKFESGTPVVREYSGSDGFVELADSGTADFVVDVFPPMAKDPDGIDVSPHRRVKRWLALSDRPYWVLFDAVPGDCLIGIRNEEQLLSCDLFVLRTSFWRDYYARAMSADLGPYIEMAQRTSRQNGTAILALLREWQRFRWQDRHVEYFKARVVSVGYPMLDPVLSRDPDDFRRELDIPIGVPVVLHLPNPYDGAWQTLWERMYVTRRLPVRLFWAALSGRADYMRNAFAPSHDGSVVDAIGRFCKKNSVFLVSKRRHSQSVSPQVARNASLVVGDESQYPHTMASLLSVADMCVGSYSSTIYESVAEDTFFLNVDIPHFPRELYQTYFPIDDVYEFPGVASSISAGNFSNDFGNMTLDDFKLDPASRESFTERYVGAVDGKSSSRFVDCLEEHIQRNGRRCGGSAKAIGCITGGRRE